MPIHTHTHTPHPTCCGKLSCRVTDGRLQMELVPEKKVFATELRVSLWWSLKCKSGWYKTTGFRPQEQYVCIIAGRSPLKHLRSTGFFSTPRTRTHQGSSDEQITRVSRIKLLLSVYLKSMWPSAPPPQSCDMQFCTFPWRIAVVSFGIFFFLQDFLGTFWSALEFGVSLNSKRRQTKPKQHNGLCERKIPQGYLLQSCVVKTKTTREHRDELCLHSPRHCFSNDSLAFRCKASLFRRRKLPLCCWLHRFTLGICTNSALRKESTALLCVCTSARLVQLVAY